jgi:hypothetical protein
VSERDAPIFALIMLTGVIGILMIIGLYWPQ